jgi:hypothetical protein
VKGAEDDADQAVTRPSELVVALKEIGEVEGWYLVVC